MKKFKRANFGRFLGSKSDVNNDLDKNAKNVFFQKKNALFGGPEGAWGDQKKIEGPGAAFSFPKK